MDVPWRYGLKNIFFMNKTFLFFKLESWNFQVQFEIKIRESSQNFNSFSFFRQLLFSSFFIGCLIELKFCKVSRNSISNRCWKFQLSILKNKKVLFLKKYFLSHTAKTHPKDGVSCLNFSEGFGSDYKRASRLNKLDIHKFRSRVNKIFWISR